MMQINDILAGISFYFIPWFIGYGAIEIVKTDNTSKEFEQALIDFFKLFSFGALVLYLEVILIYYLQSYCCYDFIKNISLNLIVLFDVAVATIGTIIGFFKNHRKANNYSKYSLQPLLIIISIFFVTSLTYFIWRNDSSLNTTLNWDIYHHQTLSNLIQKGNFAFITSDLSDSFQFATYSTIFHTLLAIPQNLFSTNMLEFWWFVEFFHLITIGFISYVFTFSFCKNRWIALFGAIFGILVFESNIAYTSLFLIPQNLTAVIATAYIADLVKNYPQTKKSTLLNLLVFAIFILLSHLVIGFFSIFLWIICLIFLTLNRTASKYKINMVLFLSSTIAIPLLYYIGTALQLNTLNRGEAEYFNYSLLTKFDYFLTFYGGSILAFLPLGIFYTLKNGKTASKNLLLLIVLFGGMSLIIAPFPYTLKLFSVLRFFVQTILALGIWMLIDRTNNVIKTVSLFSITAVMLLVFTLNIINFKVTPSYKELYTHVTPAEIAASVYLKEKYSETNVIFISEPATMHIIEGLSGINTPGGAYTSEATRRILTDIFLIRDANIPQKLFQLKDGIEADPDTVLFAVSGRFIKWQDTSDENRYGIYWNVWQPQDLTPKDYEDYGFIFYLKEILKLKEVFRNDSMIIFEIPK